MKRSWKESDIIAKLFRRRGEAVPELDPLRDGFRTASTFVQSARKDLGSYWFNKPTTRTQYQHQAFASGFLPMLGAYYSARDKTKQMDDYMANRGINWSDIKYPSSTLGYYGYSSYGSIGSTAVTYVSNNLGRLYH